MATNSSSSSSSKRPYKQWIATFGLFTLFFQIGVNYGWTSPNVARLQAPASPIPLTSVQASWIASCPGLGLLLGAALGLLANIAIGGRKNIVLAGLTFCASWIVLIATNSVAGLYAARGVGGAATGLLFSSFALFVGEISSPQIRGSLISVAMIGSPIGVLVGTVMETYLPMKTCGAAYLGQCVLSTALFLRLADSPYYLVRAEQRKLALESILFYNGEGFSAEKELAEIASFVEADASGGGVLDKLRQLSSSVSARKSMLLILFLSPLPASCGSQTLLAYMENILVASKSSDLVKPEQFVIYANAVGALSSLLAFGLVDKLGRRLSLAITMAGIASGMAGLGVHFFLLDLAGVDPRRISWLPLLSILVVLTTMIGLSTVPSTILSELFSDSAKSVASFLAAMSNAFFSFASIRVYQPMSEAVGECYVFWLFALLVVANMAYFLLALPETKGKSLRQIQCDLDSDEREDGLQV